VLPSCKVIGKDSIAMNVTDRARLERISPLRID
jgi:hypothetical protein